jgi:hypothetical protein
MKNWRSIGSGVVALLMVAGLFRDANAAPIDDLIASARKEGVILYAPSTTRLQLGEILTIVTMTDSFTHQAKLQGAPIVHAEEVTPVISPAYNAGVLKGSRHPNAGHLFSAFLSSPPAQEILQKFGGQTSAFVPGTPAYKFAQTRNVIYMKQEHAEMVDRLTSEYGNIFGFQR